MLEWIADEELTQIVQKVLAKAEKGIQEAAQKIYRNQLDPFSAIFDISTNDLSLESWLQLERRRQAQKTLQNAIGEFHQEVLQSTQGSFRPENNVLDLVNPEKGLVAEIKNKHNSMNDSSAKTTFANLKTVTNKMSRYYQYDAYLVRIIPKKPVRSCLPWSPKDEREIDSIREIDGASFYKMLTGVDTALFDLYTYLPKIISRVTGNSVAQSHFQDLYFKTYGEA